MKIRLFSKPVKGRTILSQCICDKDYEAGTHWYCSIHKWVYRGRVKRNVYISNELAKDFGWV